jgi:hypothetical protein
MASSKASRSVIAECAFLDDRVAAPRSVSWSLTAKCFTVEMIRFDCTPAIAAPTIVPASSGSSPAYSKFRPFLGSRIRLTLPPSKTLKPSARASEPIIAPPAKAMPGPMLPRPRGPTGSAVRARFSAAPPWVATPIPASVCHCAGMPRRGNARHVAGRAVARLVGRLEPRWREVGAEVALEQGQLLVERHLRQHLRCAFFGRAAGVGREHGRRLCGQLRRSCSRHRERRREKRNSSLPLPRLPQLTTNLLTEV